MTQPSKHLLEAFKASSMKPASPAPPPAATGAAPARPTATPGLFDAPARPRGIEIPPRVLGLLALVALLAVVCAFLLGRASVGSVEAAGDGAEKPQRTAGVVPELQAQPTATPPAAPAAEIADREARSPAEQALIDPRNTYTIKLLEYARSETNTARAFETLRYLTDVAGLPACLTSTSSRIVILVGAAATQAELDALLQRCKTIAGPPPLSKSAEFHDAYVDKIDKLFPRKN